MTITVAPKILNEKKNAPPENAPEKTVKSLIHKLSCISNIASKPDDVIISTMTIICKINTKFNTENIGRYLDLNRNTIVGIKYGDCKDENTNRTLIPRKYNTLKSATKKKPKKTKDSFYNQATLQVKVPSSKDKNKMINAKIFGNGSIQMTGCTTIEGAVEVIDIILREIQVIKGIIDGKNNKIVEKTFAEDVSKVNLNNILLLRIAMINSNFNIGFAIDRDKLYNIMMNENVECTYDPITHAAVIIKYNNGTDIISVFVFESGSIIITGAKDCTHIKDAYMYINKYLLTNYRFIIKNETLTNSTILKYIL